VPGKAAQVQPQCALYCGDGHIHAEVAALQGQVEPLANPA
jgi:hypothetical protein